MDLRLAAAFAGAVVIAGGGFADQELTERACSVEQIPHAVARTLEQALGDRRADEIEEICFEGLPVLYEAEFTVDGREVEIVIRPNGERVEAPAEADDDDDAGGEDDEADDDNDEVAEAQVTMADLPRPAAEALRRILGNRTAEIEAVRYEGLVVLYEVEVEGGVPEDDDEGAQADQPGARGASHRQDVDDDDDAEDDDDDARSEFFLYPDGGIAEQYGDLVEREVSMDGLPRAIAQALQQRLNGVAPDEIEEIRYEGVPILYEAEAEVDGAEREFAVRGDGSVVEGGGENAEDDASEGLREREVALADLPTAIADAMREQLKGEILEAEEVSYEGIIVLYEAETADEEVAVYPNGQLADRQRESAEDGDGDDDGAGDDDDTDDDDDDDDDVEDDTNDD